MIRFTKHLIICLFLVSCGFQSIYISEKSNFRFNKSEALGDVNLSKNIIAQLDNLKSSNGEYELKIETSFKKDISSKNKKGDPEVFDMSLEVKLTIKKDKTTIENNFREKISYNNLKSKFELKQYENDLKSNLIQKISQDIYVYLNSI